jgi:hypothetical protein
MRLKHGLIVCEVLKCPRGARVGVWVFTWEALLALGAVYPCSLSMDGGLSSHTFYWKPL